MPNAALRRSHMAHSQGSACVCMPGSLDGVADELLSGKKKSP